MRQLLILAIFLPLSAMAEENYWYFCEQNQAPARAISVHYSKAPAAVPCEVSYLNGTKTETLWSAQVKLNYCEEKAESFMKQLQQSGWRCERRKGAPPA